MGGTPRAASQRTGAGSGPGRVERSSLTERGRGGRGGRPREGLRGSSTLTEQGALGLVPAPCHGGDGTRGQRPAQESHVRYPVLCGARGWRTAQGCLPATLALFSHQTRQLHHKIRSRPQIQRHFTMRLVRHTTTKNERAGVSAANARWARGKRLRGGSGLSGSALGTCRVWR